MEVTVIRHGSAADRAPTDAERALTPRGRTEASAAGDRLAALPLSPPDRVIASPLVRARQTAELVAARLGHQGPVELDAALQPEAPPAGVRRLLARLEGARHVVLVAHEPILSAACSLLTGRSVSSLRKGELISMVEEGGSVAGGGIFAIRFRS